MKIRVVIEAEVPDVIPGYGGEGSVLRAVEMTLLDAFAEFRGARLPANDYVRRRYLNLSELELEKKVAQVEARNAIAYALGCREHGRFGSLKVTEIKPEDASA